LGAGGGGPGEEDVGRYRSSWRYVNRFRPTEVGHRKILPTPRSRT
jgi:hypothetical protein